MKIERDSTLTPGLIGYDEPKESFSIGLDFALNKNFQFGIAHERGNYTSMRFVYKNNPKKNKNEYKYKKGNYDKNDNKYIKLIKNIESNGIGVNKIIETQDAIGLELTQFVHPNIEIIEIVSYRIF